ncbi:DUF3231 family protein [Halalkalibacterium ligniniphilum]|uniref:DUF3231 family protein n=1 Tax=Halalkalibacterium ligniniphilum TaxID=1134413 RepID=UPI00034C4128|nr:DUF3231 family protein [Halalkalibacterium ligniniphilum]
MGILSGDQKQEPMHYGEVFSTWSYLSAAKSMIAGYETFYNHAGDVDLRKFLENSINQSKREIEEIEVLLKENGIGLPPSPPERPEANVASIPAGARFNDPEIAMAASRDIATGLVTCSQIIGQCTREDIATMFGQFHIQKAALGGALLRINKEKGWLVPPPLHMSVPELSHA